MVIKEAAREFSLTLEGNEVEPPAASLADADRALAAAAQVRGKRGAEADLLRYLNRAAKALEGTGHIDKLRGVLDEAVSLVNHHEAEESTEWVTGLNNLGVCLTAVARHAEAEPLMRQALAIDEKSYGKEHSMVAIRLNNLARLLQATNRLGEAEPLMERALEIILISQFLCGHELREVKVVTGNYQELLAAMQWPEERIAGRIAELTEDCRKRVEERKHSASIGQ